MANASFINLYENQAGYNAETHGVNGSEVSLIDDIKKVVYDGENVELPEGVVPGVGTALWVDGNGGKHFFEGSSVDAAKLTEQGLTFVGVVAMQKGRKLKIINKADVQAKFINCWLFKVTGYEANTPIVFNQYNKSSDSVAATISGFTPTSDDVASVGAFATALNTFLAEHQPTESTTAAETNWSAAVMADENGTDCVFMFVEGSSTTGVYQSQRQSPIASGATTGLYNMQILGVTSVSNLILRKDGVKTRSCVYNKQKFIANDTNENSPTDSVSSAGIYSKSNFTQANCPTLYAKYNGDYEAYLDDRVIKYPTSEGIINDYYGKAVEISQKMKSLVFDSVVTGEPRHIFKAADYANDGLSDLDWIIPDTDVFASVVYTFKSDFSDKINVALVKSGASGKPVSSRWTTMSSYNYAWILASSGSTTSIGYFSASSYYFTLFAEIEF